VVGRLEGRQGLVHIYTGDDKDKTTAALGQAVRAAGQGFRCLIIQFMKGDTMSGEVQALRSIPNVSLVRVGLNFIGPHQVEPARVADSLASGWETAKKAVVDGYDLVVLDEAIVAMALGVAPMATVIDIIEARGAGVELILTGRGAGSELIERADLVTEMRLIKHPFQQGYAARRGIEF
jgi:cob(I)alamin adenosyltransferase